MLPGVLPKTEEFRMELDAIQSVTIEPVFKPAFQPLIDFYWQPPQTAFSLKTASNLLGFQAIKILEPHSVI